MINYSKISKKFIKKGECYVWSGHLNNKGYCLLNRNKKMILGHRYTWALFNGPIPKYKLVLHKCRNRNCVKIEHLYLGDYYDNAKDKIKDGTNHTWNMGLTHCLKGHKFTKENTYYSNGKRSCKKCSERRKRDKRYLRLVNEL